MKKVLILGLVLIFAVALVGCNNGEATDETIGIRGEITEIYTSEDGLIITGILVEGEVQEDTMYDSGNITIDENTQIYMGEQEISPDQLDIGLMVEIVFEGPVAESYPVQGTAKKITIIE